jgi:phosphohistidine phosphatase SixA
MRVVMLVLALLMPAPGRADAWQALAAPDAVAIMRHALAPGGGDPAGFLLGDCSTQRNLDARGRAQAEAIGAAFRDRGIRFDVVLTSAWCRTQETALLVDAGPVIAAPALNSFFGDPSRRGSQTEAARALIAATEGRILLVTHQVNISALTGETTRSGEVLVIRFAGGRRGEGPVEVVGRIAIAP